MFKLA